MGNWALSANNAEFVTVNLIGKKNQVILEFTIIVLAKDHSGVQYPNCAYGPYCQFNPIFKNPCFSGQ